MQQQLLAYGERSETYMETVINLPEPKLIETCRLNGGAIGFYLVHKKARRKVAGTDQKEEYVKQVIEGRPADLPNALIFFSGLLTSHEKTASGSGLAEFRLGWDDIEDSIDDAFWKALPDEASVFDAEGNATAAAKQTLGAAIMTPIKVERIAKSKALEAEIKKLEGKALEIALINMRFQGDDAVAEYRKLGIGSLQEAVLATNAIMKQLESLLSQQAERRAKREAKQAALKAKETQPA